MKLYVYADESGTFDRAHNDLFVYGGVLVPGAKAKSDLERKYLSVERDLREHSTKLNAGEEIKANLLTLKERQRLYRVVEASKCIQFGVVVNQQSLREGVFSSKGSRQRYLDWALKMGIKKAVLAMMSNGAMPRAELEKIAVYVDEHSSSTEGRYNLKESINEEFRHGMYDPYGSYHSPVLGPDFPVIKVNYLDSKNVTLIRAADITANWIYCAERDRDTVPSVIARIASHAVIYRHPR